MTAETPDAQREKEGNREEGNSQGGKPQGAKPDGTRHRVTLYTLSTCPHCARTRQFLSGKGVQFEDYDVGQNPAALEVMRNLTAGQDSVPVIVIDGEVHVGFDQPWLERKLGMRSYDFSYFG